MDGSTIVGIHIFSLRKKIYSPSIFTPVFPYIKYIHVAMKEGIEQKIQMQKDETRKKKVE